MGKGGTRSGAGRPGWRVKAEHCKSIDVRRFAAHGVLKPGSWGWEWRDPETKAQRASIGVLTASTGLRLQYALNGEPMSQHVPLTRTACGFGGHRPWFLCPRCGRRVAVLYLRASGFACRHCQMVSYASQCADAIGRTWIKQQKLERRLGKLWARPPYMHTATHRPHRARHLGVRIGPGGGAVSLLCTHVSGPIGLTLYRCHRPGADFAGHVRSTRGSPAHFSTSANWPVCSPRQAQTRFHVSS
jgi:hypothetical protein